MPTSQHFQISKLLNLIIHLNPGSVLDIGAGFGKYGFLCREYLDCSHDHSYGTFSRRIEAIEIFEQYLTPVHQFVYDRVLVGDALKLIPTLGTKYDLTLMIDVLEHFTKSDGQRLLDSTLAKSKSLLVSVPRDIGNQSEVFGNQYEAHRAEWTGKELLTLAPSFRVRDKVSHIVFLGEKELVQKLRWIMAPPLMVAIKRALEDLFA